MEDFENFEDKPTTLKKEWQGLELFPVKVTQFIQPRGQRSPQTVYVPKELHEKVNFIVEKGGLLTAEVLSTGLVSLACEYDDDDLVLELSSNGPRVLDTLEKVITKAYEKIKEMNV